ncbi:AraC family transcriptional regulator [Fundidesulfovibrio agrisoli]|uniref:AraC family transcriptional regulator n=1 Tax=Fundidesulfovibrio agrisoli TaxID=2922717 RepID=UPI001FACD797|nr:AraC family transcriptional regulator [Fundidesulfovibrio agrisoli]
MKDSARYWIEHDLGGLECLQASFVNHRFAPHAHEEFVIGVIQAGAQRARYRGGDEIMPADTTCVMNAGEQHTGHGATEAGWSYRVVYPHPAILQGIASQLAGRPVGVPAFDELVIRDDELTRGLLALHAALDSGCATPLAKQSLLTWALARLIGRHASPRPPAPSLRKARPGIQRARDYLDAHHARAPGLDELAAVACMSPYHFVRSFGAEVGVPPHIYQLQRRIEGAKRLLAGGASIADVAAATGFADQSHLTNRFKAVVGVTPGAFRKKSKNLQDGSAAKDAEAS